jgi:hypothetical protein
MRRFLALGLSISLLAGCSYFDRSGNWTKPGTPDEQLRSDLDACESAARAQTRVERGIDQDIAATQGAGALGDPMADSGMSGYQSGKRYDDVVDECMRAFGYVRE